MGLGPTSTASAIRHPVRRACRSTQANVPVILRRYADESDPGPYPIPADAPVEGGGDRHVLDARQGNCMLFELFAASRHAAGWHADSGA